MINYNGKAQLSTSPIAQSHIYNEVAKWHHMVSNTLALPLQLPLIVSIMLFFEWQGSNLQVLQNGEILCLIIKCEGQPGGDEGLTGEAKNLLRGWRACMVDLRIY